MRALVFLLSAAGCVASAEPELRFSGNGTGFFVTPDGYFVTNYHVIDGAALVKVKVGEELKSAVVLKTDASNDIAVLKVEGTYQCLPLGEDLQARPGEEVFTVGFPMAEVMGISPKTTLGTISAVSGMKDDPRAFQISVQIQPGNSGGPLVLKSSGNVIGVTSSSLNTQYFISQGLAVPQNVNYAMKSSYIRPLLATIPGLAEKLPPLHAGERSWRDIQQDVEACVGLVAVYQLVDASAPPPRQEPAASEEEQEQPPAKRVWVFADSSQRRLTRADLVGLDKDALWRARNEIYARNGLIFSTPRGKALAEALGAEYRGTETDQDRVAARLNPVERANVELIRSIEQGL